MLIAGILKEGVSIKPAELFPISILENANKPTQNTGSGTNDLRGGLVFLTLDVLGSVIANIESGTVNVWIRTSQLPL